MVFYPVNIKWNFDEKDSILRVKDPIYVRNDYYLIDYKDKAFSKKIQFFMLNFLRIR